MMTKRAFLVSIAATVALAASVLSAPTGPVPTGIYTLSKIGSGRLMVLGTLEIRGTTYRVGEEGGFAPFTQDGSGNITWSAGLNIMPEGWKLGASKFVGQDEFKRPLIKINYMSPRQAAEVIDAVKEK